MPRRSIVPPPCRDRDWFTNFSRQDKLFLAKSPASRYGRPSAALQQ